MKNILLLVGLCGAINAFAAPANTAASAPSALCQQYHKQMQANHQAIDTAYHKNDACAMGKLMIQNRQMFESHPECFPRAGQMQRKMMQGSGKPNSAN
jgi:hypothetical protein